MQIGTVADKSGVSAKAIRYYESIGLIQAASRSDSGYRIYGERDLRTLRFIQRARSLGFSVEEVGALLTLWRDTDRHSAQVKALAGRQVEDIDRKIAELGGMRDTLIDLMERCHGDDRPDCPILDDLAGEAGN
jgi:MerR family copper efflux transcriptional regulator